MPAPIFSAAAPLFAQARDDVTRGGNTGTGWLLVLLAFTLGLVALAAFRFYTRAGILAAATTKEAVRQPVFLLAAAISVVVLVLNTFLPFFSMGDDVKMLKDCGLATILIGGLLVAVWTASTSIADEIEGKTAMTLLSKPINRRQFVVGKYVGILQAVGLMTAFVGAVLFGLVLFKVGYDAKESGGGATPWLVWQEVGGGFEFGWIHPKRLFEGLQLLPGLLLVFFEIAVLTAISVAISTRLPMVVNMTACFTVFVIGHLTGVLAQYQGGGEAIEAVRFVAGLIATVLPALPVYSSEAAVATGAFVPPLYLATTLFYTVCYCAAAVLVAFILFEDRDLA